MYDCVFILRINLKRKRRKLKEEKKYCRNIKPGNEIHIIRFKQKLNPKGRKVKKKKKKKKKNEGY